MNSGILQMRWLSSCADSLRILRRRHNEPPTKTATIVHSSTFQMQTGRTAPGRNAPRLSMHQPYLPTAAACRPVAGNTLPCCKRPSRPSVHAPAPSLSSLTGIPLHAKAMLAVRHSGRALFKGLRAPGIRCHISNRAIDDWVQRRRSDNGLLVL